MKFLVFLSLAVLAAARPQELVAYEEEEPQQVEEKDSGIISQYMTYNEDGSLAYGYKTSDDQAQDVNVETKQIGEKSGTAMQGSYSFTAKDENGNDVPVVITWVADEEGFRAEGDAIPVAPEDPNAAAQQAARDAAVASGYSADQDEFNQVEVEEQFDD